MHSEYKDVSIDENATFESLSGEQPVETQWDNVEIAQSTRKKNGARNGNHSRWS